MATTPWPGCGTAGKPRRVSEHKRLGCPDREGLADVFGNVPVSDKPDREMGGVTGAEIVHGTTFLGDRHLALEDMDELDKSTGRENGEAPGTIHAEMAEFLKQFRDTHGSIDMTYFKDFREGRFNDLGIAKTVEEFAKLGETEVKVESEQ